MDSRKSLARIAGFLYLAMMPFAAFWLSQRFALAAPGDPARTAATMAASEGLLRASIVSWLIAQTIFVFLCFGYLFDAARECFCRTSASWSASSRSSASCCCRCGS